MLWDASTGKQIGKLEGHRGQFVSLGFTPDGRFLVSGSSDTTGLIWDYRRLLHKVAGTPGSLSPEHLDKIWVDLQNGDAERGYRAVWALVESHEAAIEFLRGKIPPATAEEQRQLQPWIDEVDSDKYAVRQRAESGLAKLGLLAEPAIQQALRGPLSLEAKRRLEKALGTPSTAPCPFGWRPSELWKSSS